MKKFVILAAGGSGTRMNADRNKIFLTVSGSPVLKKSILLFDDLVDEMVIVCKPDDFLLVKEISDSTIVSFSKQITFGGDTRQHSVLNGLKHLHADPEDIVLVHDAARCTTPKEVVINVIDSCIRYGSGVPGIPAVNTMKYADSEHFIKFTADRENLFEIQTPQGFIYKDLYKAYLLSESEHYSGTDDSSLVERIGIPVHLVPGSRRNIKITEKDDLMMIHSVAESDFSSYRIGYGYDVHRLVEGRRLILCGVEIPHSLGLLGHSDADVALHALMDALLGAASQGDIGKHFPDTSEKYKDISSLHLLHETMQIVRNAGYDLMNADVTIIAQKPKILPYIPEMVHHIARTIDCDEMQINVKATTTEKLGFEGREEGISASAVCLLKRIY